MSLFPSPRVSALADVIVALLQDRPEDWKGGNHTLDHPSGLSLWTANGFWFLALRRPDKIKFGWKKIPLWFACHKALRIAKERKEIERLNAVRKSLDTIRDNVVQFRRARP